MSLYLPLLSFFKNIVIEHNTIMDTELLFLQRKVEHCLHRYTLFWFRLGIFKHIAVNNELKFHLEAKGLKQVIYAQNGYIVPNTSYKDFDDETLAKLNAFQANHTHTAIFCGNGYPWHGFSRIAAILEAYPHIGLLVVGPYKHVHAEHIFQLPFCNTEQLGYLIERCDFAISTFQWELLNIHEGSPLKSRHYLCHGCPILTHYYDCAADFDALKPFVVDYRKTPETCIQDICSLDYDKETLKSTARDLLSWDRYFDRVFA